MVVEPFLDCVRDRGSRALVICLDSLGLDRSMKNAYPSRQSDALGPKNETQGLCAE